MVVKGSCPDAPLGLCAATLAADVAYLRLVAQFFGAGRRCGIGEGYRCAAWRGRLPWLTIGVHRDKTVKRLSSASPMRAPAGGGGAAAPVTVRLLFAWRDGSRSTAKKGVRGEGSLAGARLPPGHCVCDGGLPAK